MAQDVLDHVFPQPRGIVIEMQDVGFLIDAKSLQAVGIRKHAEGAKLLRVQLVLQFVTHGHECHKRQYSIAAKSGDAVRAWR